MCCCRRGEGRRVHGAGKPRTVNWCCRDDMRCSPCVGCGCSNVPECNDNEEEMAYLDGWDNRLKNYGQSASGGVALVAVERRMQCCLHPWRALNMFFFRRDGQTTRMTTRWSYNAFDVPRWGEVGWGWWCRCWTTTHTVHTTWKTTHTHAHTHTTFPCPTTSLDRRCRHVVCTADGGVVAPVHTLVSPVVASRLHGATRCRDRKRASRTWTTR